MAKAKKKETQAVSDKAMTPEKIPVFLAAVVKYGGNITAACEEAQIHRQYIYLLEGENEDFARDFRTAQRQGLAVLEDEARRRAYVGCVKPVFYQGQVCGTVQEYSDTLMIFLLKGGMPEKYRENTNVKVSGDPENPLRTEHGVTPALAEALAALKRNDDV